MRSSHSAAVNHIGKAIRTAAVIMGIACCMLVCLWIIPSKVGAEAGQPCPSGGEHEYSVRLVRQATADKEGLRIYTCKKCSYSFKESIPKTGHDWTEWKVKTPPTSKTIGIEERRCTKCGITEERYMKEDPQNTQTQEANESDEAEGTGNRTSPKKKPVKEEVSVKTVTEKENNKSKDENKDSPEIAVSTNYNSNGHDSGKGKESGWNIYNTAVAAGGSLLIAILALVIYNLYLVPLLWIRRKLKSKQQEVMRRMNV